MENWKRYLNEGGAARHVFRVDVNRDLSQDPDGFETAKLPITVEFRNAEADETIDDSKCGTPQTGGWGDYNDELIFSEGTKFSPEWNLYDFKIYDKILTEDEQIFVANHLAKEYKVTL